MKYLLPEWSLFFIFMEEMQIFDMKCIPALHVYVFMHYNGDGY